MKVSFQLSDDDLKHFRKIMKDVRARSQQLSEEEIIAATRELLDEMSAYLTDRPAYRELVSEMLSLRPEVGSEAGRESELVRAVRRFVGAGVARGEVSRRHSPEVLADLLFGALTVALTNWCADDGYDLRAGLGDSAHALLELFS